jgi:diguanylate cyclase (GGDEF)-like protein/PAS domain S-box-containing protein
LTSASKITAGFGACFALLLGAGLGAALQTLDWEKSARSVARSNEAIETLEELSLKSTDAEDAARRFMAAPNRLDLARCGEELGQAKKREAEIEPLIADNPVLRGKMAEVRRLLSRQTDTIKRSIASEATLSGNPGDVREAMAALNGDGLSSELRAAILQMEAEERRLLHQGMLWQEESGGLSRMLFGLVSVFSLILIIIGGCRMSRDQKKKGVLESTLAAKDEQYKRVVELAGDIIYRTDEQGRFTFCNSAALTMLHFTQSEVMGRVYLKLIRQDKRRTAERFYIKQFARKHKNTYYEFPVIDGHGRERWLGQNVQLIIEGGKITGFQAIAREITERKRAEFELQKSRKFVERIAATTPGILYVYDLVEHRKVYNNREVITVLGYSPEEILKMEGRNESLFHPNDQAMIIAHHEALRRAQDGEVRRLEFRARHADGHWVWLSGRETPFERGADGLVTQIVGISQDITARKAAQDKLAYQANYDALTGLSNRHHFWTGLQSALRRASIEQSGTALCLFDVDLFKDINDRFGHAAGDEVLETIGKIVRAELRSPADIAGRLGGDEFCFALPGSDRDECARVAERIRERLETLAFGMSAGLPFSVTATFGVAEAEHDNGWKELMEAADRALYRAKSAGRNRVIVEALGPTGVTASTF